MFKSQYYIKVYYREDNGFSRESIVFPGMAF